VAMPQAPMKAPAILAYSIHSITVPPAKSSGGSRRPGWSGRACHGI
jgi:hypothetical protein